MQTITLTTKVNYVHKHFISYNMGQLILIYQQMQQWCHICALARHMLEDLVQIYDLLKIYVI